MKELSIEEKAKAYDNIIEKANKMHSENCEACQMCIEELIPELAESEDEKIRKDIKEILDKCLNIRPQLIEEPQYLKAIAWLEKQGEKDKFIKKELGYIKGYRENVIKRLEELEKQDEQKPTTEEILKVKHCITGISSKKAEGKLGELIKELYDKGPENFTCKLCTDTINPNSCTDCPIYAWGHDGKE